MFIAIDLKSFYASVECRERKLDPLATNLVVADVSRTEKTICLAVSPSLKAHGIPGRARLFEVTEQVRRINEGRMAANGGRPFSGKSADAGELASDPSLMLDFIAAPPRMQLYMDYSTRIYGIYLRYIAPEDIHVYSIDEVLIDVSGYLGPMGMTASELCAKLISEVQRETGITATGGVGTNLYLAKVAMDMMAKHMQPDADGIRIAELDELSYRRYLWTHRPLTDFWRVGKGYARKLEAHGILTMGDIARASVEREDLLFDLFGVNAQHLIDHAWGFDDTTMRAIRAYRPGSSSVGEGQVLPEPYTFERGKLVIREMADRLALELLRRMLVTDQIVLTVNYDRENLDNPDIRKLYGGPVTTDWYGRKVPKHAHGSTNLSRFTSSSRIITDAAMALSAEILNPVLLIRRISIAANHVISEQDAPPAEPAYEQLDLFTDYGERERRREAEERALTRERRAQEAVLEIQKKFGKNAILRGTSLEEGATGRQRNEQIGGHRKA